MVKNTTITKTTTVDLVISSQVGQVTFLSSARASFKNFIAFIYLPHFYLNSWFRVGRNRTLISGFGDRRSTIELPPLKQKILTLLKDNVRIVC